MRALLDSVPASDPVLVLALVDGPLQSVPRDVRAWFGLGRDNKIELVSPLKVSVPFSSVLSAPTPTYGLSLLPSLSYPAAHFPSSPRTQSEHS
jgi:hypothetical protein